MHDAAEILVLQHVAAEVDLDAVELVQNLLEPQFVGLVHDDEQHLVVRGPAVAYALRRLRRQEIGQLQVVGVVEAACGDDPGIAEPFPWRVRQQPAVPPGRGMESGLAPSVRPGGG